MSTIWNNTETLVNNSIQFKKIRACVRCYTRKQKCSRTLPGCTRCAESYHKCIYPDQLPPNFQLKRRTKKSIKSCNNIMTLSPPQSEDDSNTISDASLTIPMPIPHSLNLVIPSQVVAKPKRCQNISTPSTSDWNKWLSIYLNQSFIHAPIFNLHHFNPLNCHPLKLSAMYWVGYLLRPERNNKYSEMMTQYIESNLKKYRFDNSLSAMQGLAIAWIGYEILMNEVKKFQVLRHLTRMAQMTGCHQPRSKDPQFIQIEKRLLWTFIVQKHVSCGLTNQDSIVNTISPLPSSLLDNCINSLSGDSLQGLHSPPGGQLPIPEGSIYGKILNHRMNFHSLNLTYVFQPLLNSQSSIDLETNTKILKYYETLIDYLTQLNHSEPHLVVPFIEECSLYHTVVNMFSCPNLGTHSNNVHPKDVNRVIRQFWMVQLQVNKLVAMNIAHVQPLVKLIRQLCETLLQSTMDSSQRLMINQFIQFLTNTK